MDSDFEDQDFEIPASLQQQSQTARQEANAARELPTLIGSLRHLLISHAYRPSPTVLRAVALVDASCDDRTDIFYESETWKRCSSDCTSIEGSSFRELLALAQGCLQELQT